MDDVLSRSSVERYLDLGVKNAMNNYDTSSISDTECNKYVTSVHR